MNIEQLKSLCSWWKEKLGLAHWNIALQICREHDMPISNSQGSNQISLSNEQALISILDSSDFPHSPFMQDMEVSLVHELLRIPLRYITEPQQDSIEDILLEAFIERTARSLVQLSRDN